MSSDKTESGPAVSPAVDTFEVENDELHEILLSVAKTFRLGVFRTGPAGEWLYVDDRWCEIMQVSREDVSNENASAHVHPDDVEEARRKWREAVASNGELLQEFRTVREDGTIQWIESNAFVSRDCEGNAQGMMGALRDVTDIHEAHEAQEESENRWRSIWENSPQTMTIISLDGTILDINRTTHVPRDQLLGRSAFDFTPPDQRREYLDALEEVKCTGKAQLVSSCHEVDGRRFWFDGIYIPVYVKGKLSYLINSVLDRTADKQNEEDLIAAARVAGMAEFASAVLHNVGNTLTSVRVATRELRDSAEDSKLELFDRIVAMLNEHEGDLPAFFAPGSLGTKLPKLLGALGKHLHDEREGRKETIGRLEMLVDHVTDVIRAQQDTCKGNAVEARVRPRALFEDALTICSASHPARDEELILKFDEISIMIGDANKILQILVNLIGNARDAMLSCDDRSGQLVLGLARRSGDRIAFSVRDNGLGISAEHLGQIFQHGFTTKEDGHGFGLHSCSNSARELGGTIQVTSDGVGAGAEFTLILPLRATNSDPES